jgi:acyl-coenzyme A thioesterase PaaI-like protein
MVHPKGGGPLAHHLFIYVDWEMELMKRYPQCFVCGDKNPFGLNVAFYVKDDKVVAEYIAGSHFQGYKDILHGGILSALLDEVMIRAVLAQGILSLTSEIKVRFKKLVKVGDRLFLEGRLIEDKGRMLLAEGKITNQDDEVVAWGEGKFFKAVGDMEKLLAQNLE